MQLPLAIKRPVDADQKDLRTWSGYCIGVASLIAAIVLSPVTILVILSNETLQYLIKIFLPPLPNLPLPIQYGIFFAVVFLAFVIPLAAWIGLRRKRLGGWGWASLGFFVSLAGWGLIVLLFIIFQGMGGAVIIG